MAMDTSFVSMLRWKWEDVPDMICLIFELKVNTKYIAIKMIFKSVLKIDNSVPLELMGA
jgi:hypothetical protein